MNRQFIARVSDHDRKAVVGLAKGSPPGNSSVSYKNDVVFKPWGYEFLLGQGSLVGAWCLRIERGHQTSMHCHPEKDTVLMVLGGEGRLSTLNDSIDLHPGTLIFLESGVFHQTAGIGESLLLLELESPVDKYDLLRLEDAYGRQNKGYEKIVTESDIRFASSHPRTPFLDFDLIGDSGSFLSFEALGLNATMSFRWVRSSTDLADELKYRRVASDYNQSRRVSIYSGDSSKLASKFLVWECNYD